MQSFIFPYFIICTLKKIIHRVLWFVTWNIMRLMYVTIARLLRHMLVHTFHTTLMLTHNLQNACCCCCVILYWFSIVNIFFGIKLQRWRTFLFLGHLVFEILTLKWHVYVNVNLFTLLELMHLEAPGWSQPPKTTSTFGDGTLKCVKINFQQKL